MTSSPISLLCTLVKDGWRESNRPELLAVCRLQHPTDDHPARAHHPHPLVISPAIQVPAVAMLLEEGSQAVEEVAQLANIRVHCGEKPKAGEVTPSTATF
jgi:hypothetical protein